MPSVSDAINSLEVPANPFMDDAPLGSIFPGAGRKTVLDQLQHLARFSSDISALVGQLGSGKTVLGEFFVRQAQNDQMVARISGNLLSSRAALLIDILNVFVVSYSQEASLEELQAAFVDFVQSARSRSRTVVLIVDDAHELGDEAFGMLVRLALLRNDENSFHLMLLGEQALVDMLECTCPMKNGRNQFTVSALEAFSLDDTKKYLRYRLNSEGFGYGDPERPLPFTKRQLEKIHHQSNGVPGLINGLAAFEFNTPSKGAADTIAGFWASFPRPYAYGLLALCVVFGAIVLALGLSDAKSSGQVSISIPVSAAQETVSASPEISAPASNVEAQPLTQAASSPFVPPPPLRIATTQQPEPQLGSDAGSDATPNASDVSADAVVASDETAAVVQAPIVSPAAPAVTERPVPPPITPAVRPSTPAETKPSSVSDLPSNQYTIQLLGASSKANIEDFLRRNAGSPLYMFEARNNGRPWFVVVHGVYATRAEAQRAVAGLGPKLAVDQPWIRQISAVQADMAP